MKQIMKNIKLIAHFVFLFLLSSCEAFDPFTSMWSDDAAARYYSRFLIMKPQLKNPDTAKFSNMKIRYKDSAQRNVDGVQTNVSRYVVSFDLNAENSFGGRATEGYCLALSVLPKERYIVDVSPQKCERENPTAEEIELIKTLARYK